MSYKTKVLKYVNDLDDVFIDIALYNIDGLTYEEAKNYLEKDASPVSGAVSGLIYYIETNVIGSKYYEDCMEMIQQVYGDEIKFEIVKSLNNIVWICWELWLNAYSIEKVLNKALELEILKPTNTKKYIILDVRYNEVVYKEIPIYKEDEKVYEDQIIDSSDSIYMEVNDDTTFENIKIDKD